jgi:hypothetical protein
VDGFIPAVPTDAPAAMPEPSPDDVEVSDREFEAGDREFEPSETGPEATGWDVFGTMGDEFGSGGLGAVGSGLGGGGSGMGMVGLGSVSISHGGVSGGRVSGEPIQVDRSYQTATTTVAGVSRHTVLTREDRGGRKGKPKRGKGGKDRGPDTVDFGAIISEPLDSGLPEVYASALSVVVPSLGETVKYQHLLVPAGEAYSVPLDVQRTHSE